jgi:hypothetical protein
MTSTRRRVGIRERHADTAGWGPLVKLRLRILPVEVFGRSSTKCTERGTLYAASCRRQWSTISVSLAR